MLKPGLMRIATAALACLAAISWSGAGWAQNTANLSGVVKDAAGKPVEGAYVQMRNVERRLHFMVITQGAGKYTNNRLPAGKYVVQAVGGEFQSAPTAPIDVTAGKPAAADLALTVARAPALAPAWPGRLPGQRGEAEGGEAVVQRMPDGAGKTIIQAKCLSCHDAVRVTRSRVDQERWQQIMLNMKLYAQGSSFAKALDANEEKTVLAYLVANYAPVPGSARAKPDPLSRLPRTLQPAGQRDYIVVEYELPSARAQPHEVAVDANGNGWVTQRVGGNVGKFDVKTMAYVEFSPPAAASTTVRLNAIRRGNKGELWMIDGGPNRRWLSFDPKTEKFEVYNLPPTQSGNASGNTMRVHPDNTVWLNSIAANQVIKLDPATKQFTFYEVPAGVARKKTASPYGMAVGGDGNIWIVENAVDQIARIDRATGKFEEFKIPVREPVARKLGSDWDGNLWVGLHGAGKLLRVNYKTLEMKEFEPPSADAGVYLADPDMKNKVMWSSLHHVDKLGRLDPATGAWAEYPLLYAETDVRRMEVDPNNPTRIWYSGVLSSRIGYVELLR